MTPKDLASIFTALDAYGVESILRAESSVNAFDPPNHSTAVWVTTTDWACAYDALFLENDEPPHVRATVASTGHDLTLAMDAPGFRIFVYWPLKDMRHVADQLLASGVDQKKVNAWTVLGGAL